MAADGYAALASAFAISIACCYQKVSPDQILFTSVRFPLAFNLPDEILIYLLGQAEFIAHRLHLSRLLIKATEL
jgi:hypothetical protein